MAPEVTRNEYANLLSLEERHVDDLLRRKEAHGEAWWVQETDTSLRQMCLARGLVPWGGKTTLANRLMHWDPTSDTEPLTPKQLRYLLDLQRRTGVVPEPEAFCNKHVCTFTIARLEVE